MRGIKSVLRSAASIFKPGVGNMMSVSQLRVYDDVVYQVGSNTTPLSDAMGSLWTREAGVPNPVQGISNGQSSQGQQLYDIIPGAQLWTVANETDRCIIGTSEFNSDTIGKSLSLYSLQVFAGDPETEWSSAPVYCQLYTPYNEDGSDDPTGSPDMVWPVPRPPAMLSFQPGVRSPFNMPRIFQTNGFNGTTEGGGLFILSSTPYTFTIIPDMEATIAASWAYVFGVNVSGLPVL